MFNDNSDVLLQLLEAPPVKRPKVLIFVDSNLLTANSRLLDDIASFKKRHGVHVDKVGDVQILPSGEIVKIIIGKQMQKHLTLSVALIFIANLVMTHVSYLWIQIYPPLN